MEKMIQRFFKLWSDENSVQSIISKLLNFFSIFNIIVLLIMWGLCNKYCACFWRQKPGKLIFTVRLYLNNSYSEKCCYIKNSTSIAFLSFSFQMFVGNSDRLYQDKVNFWCNFLASIPSVVSSCFQCRCLNTFLSSILMKLHFLHHWFCWRLSFNEINLFPMRSELLSWFNCVSRYTFLFVLWDSPRECVTESHIDHLSI